MILICSKYKKCKNYKREYPCWDEQSKGKTIICSEYRV